MDELLASLFGGTTAGGLLGGMAAYNLAEGSIDQARGLPQQLADAATGIGAEVGSAAAFKPYTIKTAQGTSDFTGEGVETNLAQQGLIDQLNRQAQGQAQGLNNQVNLGYLPQQAFSGAENALRANSGQFANMLGGRYAAMGERQAQAQAPQDLARLQAAFGTQALQGPTGPSQGLLGLQGLQGQADFSGAGADVTGAYRGITAPGVSQGAGNIGQQATQAMNLGAQAQDVSGMFSGVGTSPFQTSTAQTVGQQAMQGVNAAGQYSDVSGAYRGISAPNVSTASGGLAQQALGQTNLGATASDVTNAYSGITAPSVRTGAGTAADEYFAAGSGMLSQDTPTAQSVYDQIRATQSPEEERQRIALENRLAAQGRLGVSTAQYGGTPEQLAMEKAQAEARNAASLQAIQTADTLASSQQNRATQLTQMGLSADQVQAQMNAEGFGQEMNLAGSQLQTAQTQEALQSSVQNRQAQLAQLGLSADQIQAQLQSEGFNQQMQLGQAGLQTATLQSQLQNEAQSRATQLQQLGMSAEQVQNQLLSEGFSQDMALAGANLQSAQAQEAMQASVQARQAQLAQLGLSAEQIQAQLESEGFSQQLQLGQAGIQAQQAQSDLENASQARAAQLAQLGMSAEQIGSQLASEGLSRQVTSATTAANLAQTGAGIQAQQQQLGQGLLGLGLQAQQLGGTLGSQDIANASGLFGLGSSATMLPQQQQAAQLQNMMSTLTAAGIPQAQALAMMQPGLTGMQYAQQGGQTQAQAIANLGQQQLASMPSAINAEALLKQAQLESVINALGLQNQYDKEGNMLGSALDGVLDTGLNWLGDQFGGLFS